MATSDFVTASALLAGRLGEKGLAHSMRVADTAAKLAERYGVDGEHARLAGLLHDWDRELSREDLLSAAHRCGFTVNPVEVGSPYLLHARTGALAVAEVFPDTPREVVDAITRHTIGAPEMTDLDMVLFVADMIEPERSFPGVDDLRRAAESVSLRELFALAYRRSMAHIIERGKPIHPDTVGVWNGLVARWHR